MWTHSFNIYISLMHNGGTKTKIDEWEVRNKFGRKLIKSRWGRVFKAFDKILSQAQKNDPCITIKRRVFECWRTSTSCYILIFLTKTCRIQIPPPSTIKLSGKKKKNPWFIIRFPMKEINYIIKNSIFVRNLFLFFWIPT